MADSSGRVRVDEREIRALGKGVDVARFDVARLVSDADRLGELDAAGGPAHRRASEYVSASLAEAGWDVRTLDPERHWVSLPEGIALTLCVFLLATGTYLSFAYELTRLLPFLPRVFRFGVPAAVLGLSGALVLRRVFVRLKRHPLNQARTILATQNRQAPGNARVVVVAPLSFQETSVSFWLRNLSFLVFGMTGILFIDFLLEAERARPRVVCVVLAVQVAAVFVLAALDPIVDPKTFENRTGFAFLAELARTWPDRLRQRVETWLVLLPVGDARFRSLKRACDDGIPTIWIVVHGVGRGPELFISGKGQAVDLAESAAQSLWIPHRTDRLMQRSHKPPLVSIGGKENLPIVPEQLGRAAQLVTEIAMRWAKRADCA